MTHIEIQDLDHDQISEKVRIELAHRLTRLLDKFEIFLDDDPRDFSPGQISNYLNAVKILASLYQAHQRPVDKSGMISAEKVEKLLEAARTQATLEAVENERLRVQAEARMAIEAAGTGIREALTRERDRQARALGR